MKTSIKLMLAAGLLSLGFATNVSATTVDVFITGANASRGSFTNAIAHLLTNPQAAFIGKAASGNTPATVLAGSNQQLIWGTLTTGVSGIPAGTTVYFHTAWSGSLAGIASLVYNIPASLSYLPDTVSTSAVTAGSGANPNAGAAGGTLITSASAATISNTLSDGAFTEVAQSSTSYTGAPLTLANGHVNLVAPFVWVGNPDLAAYVTAAGGSIKNITATQVRQLVSGGLDLAQLTGNDSDDANSAGFAYPVGRNVDGATRFVAFAESGFNPVGGAAKEPVQYAVSTSGSTVLVNEYPVDTLFPGTSVQQTFTLGQSGYGTGTLEAAALSVSGTSGANSNNPSYLIGYLSESDASTVVQAGGSFLSYDGISYGSINSGVISFNRKALDEGEYTFWSYDRLYYKSGNTNGALLDALAAQIRNVDAGISGEYLSNMAVQRAFEGGPISYVGIGNSTR